MKAYLYGNKAYPRKAPEYAHYIDIIAGEIIDSVWADIKYDKALKEWEASGKIVENIEHIEQYENPMTKKTYPKDVIIINGDYFGSYPGQQVETGPSEDKVIVTKIN